MSDITAHAQAVTMTEAERHAVAHARYQVERADPDNPECLFDFELVKDLLRVIDRAAQPPAAPVVTQHIGWLKQYIGVMDETNWRDMRLLAERQLEGLSADLAPAAPVDPKVLQMASDLIAAGYTDVDKLRSDMESMVKTIFAEPAAPVETDEDELELTKGRIARAIYDVANRWVAGNFPEGHQFLDFSQVDERTCNLHLDYADAVLAVLPKSVSRSSAETGEAK